MTTDLSDGACAVWWGHRSAYHDGLLANLDATERARHAAYRQPEDRQRFALGAAITRRVLAGHLGIPAAAVPLDRSCADCDRPHGKVRVTGAELSVSHSGDWVTVAFHRSAPVGIDVERINPDVEHGQLASTVLSPAEAATLEALDEWELAQAFTVYWARKEAIVKATGDGLRVPFARITVSGPGEPARLRDWPDRPDLHAQLQDLTPGAGYAAAVAILGAEPVAVREHDASPLLA